MAKKSVKRYAVTEDGARRRITGERGRYWICGRVLVRKSRAVVEGEEPAQEA